MNDEFTYSLDKLKMAIVFLVDTSASMVGRKIEQLNEFMAEAVAITEDFALNEGIRIPMRVIEFNSEANWLVGDANNGVEHINWMPLNGKQNCHTDTAQAIDLARSIMHWKFLGFRNLHPAVVLISDGLSDDLHETIESIENLKHALNGKVVRLGVCVEGANEEALVSFATKGFECPLVIRADEQGLFRRFLQSSVAHPRITPAYPEEYQPAIPVIDDPDWDEEDGWVE